MTKGRLADPVSSTGPAVDLTPPRSLSARFLVPLHVAMAALPLHVLLALSTDLSPDEAYYLAATRAGPSALVDHPPLVWLLLRLTAPLELLPLELRVRIWPIGLSFVSTLGLAALARRRGADDTGAFFAALAGTFALLPMAGGFVATPDAPLLAALLVAFVAADDERPGRVGVALFVASVAKVVALPIALAVAWGARRRSVRIGALAGPAVALLLLVPSLLFQLRHAFVPTARPGLLAAAGAIGEAFGAQIALWSPWLIAAGVRGLSNPTDRGVVGFLTVLILASATARGAPPEANWWAPAACILIVAACARPIHARWRPAAFVWLVVPTLLAASHVVRPWLPLAFERDPTARLHGWSSGEPPVGAPGVGPYGPASERCVYQRDCKEIDNYFNAMQLKNKF